MTIKDIEKLIKEIKERIEYDNKVLAYWENKLKEKKAKEAADEQ